MPAEEPRPAELARQYAELSKRMDAGFRDVGQRLDRMPTNDILLAYLATRDQEMKTQGEDIKDIVASLAKETAERRAALEAERNARLAEVKAERSARRTDVDAERTARELQAKTDRDRADQTRRFSLTFGLSCLVVLLGLATFILNLMVGS